LERKKIVRTAAYFGSIRYFPAHSDGGSAMERTLRTVLTRRRPAQILRGIAETPGIRKEELTKRIGIAGTTLAWHLRRFAKSGIALKSDDGWILTPEAAEVWEELNS
jgi:predicted transcriptional regulator